jgi:preprotein translocase subunit SecA
MPTNFLTQIFGSRNQRLLKSYGKLVNQANALEPAMQAASDEALREKTSELRRRCQEGESLERLLPEAFAAVREASRRTLGLRHFDVQLIGGIALHQGKIAEMRTGEGKTLVATLSAYLNSLTGKGVHIVTVNEYLAQRDADWMGPIYRFLGLTVGVIKSGQDPATKREAYAADITYGTNNEFGFDYLRDNLAYRVQDKAQRELHYAIVDEVDSILIDEARTPLIISGPSEESTEMYARVNAIVPRLKRQESEEGAGDYWADEKSRQVHLSEEGLEHIESLLEQSGMLSDGGSVYDAVNLSLMHHMNAALRAHSLYKRDVEYIVKDGEIVIVDEFTGRTMPGRRWSDGLHQAIEAKEGVRIKEENQTLASITFQNYFRMYGKLAGMTGTADTEAYEFQQIYNLEVVVIPTHKPMVRADNPDLVYLTQSDKFQAIIEDIKDCHTRGQPVLVGTTSIETSEYLSGLLEKQKLVHEVLNAKQHAREAEIVAQAGRPGSITIATNMAGRGTDIVLGGNWERELAGMDAADDAARAAARAAWTDRHEEVVAAGGLHIVGTERHESRRIDNQLRGRSGRQGDPGSSRFYLSMEDNLMRIFGDPMRTKRLLERVGMRPGEVIESRMLTRQIERAQRKVEAHNFDIRKQLLEYDDVANDQRKVVYAQRAQLMADEDVIDAVYGIRAEVVNEMMDDYVAPGTVEEQWNVPGLTTAIERELGMRLDVQSWLDADKTLDEHALRARAVEELDKLYEAKCEQVGKPVMRHLERVVMLQRLDLHWKEHLAAMDYLRQGIHLRGYAQRNPKQEYKREAFQMFTDMLQRVRHDTTKILCKLQVRTEQEVEQLETRRAPPRMQFVHPDAAAVAAAPAAPAPSPAVAGPAMAPLGQRPAMAATPGGANPAPFVRNLPKVGRNEPCPCGSGKKYKHCHGRLN